MPPARAADAPVLSIADAVIVEGNSTYRELLFPVSLSQSLPYDVSASVKTRDISATSPTDYTAQTAGKIVIKAGQTGASILIRVSGDDVEEKDEKFAVQLSQPKRVSIGDGDAIGSVQDDDYAGQISVSDTAVAERNSGQKVAKVQVSLSQPCLHEIVVYFRTLDGSATAAGGDYLPAFDPLVFKPGRLTLSVAVPIVGDTLAENDETLAVSLRLPGYPLATFAKSSGTIAILNDDVLAPRSSGKIVFESSRDGNSEIYVMNGDGTHQTRLTNDASSDINPSFSRDGSKIVWISSRGVPGYQGVWVMNADGSDPQKIYKPKEGAFYAHPRFAPDGQIAVTATDLNVVSAIVLLNPDGTNPRTIVGSSDIFAPFSFTPDGAQIVFPLKPLSDPRFKIGRVNLNGSGVTPLTTGLDSAYEGGPSVSPDGCRIAFEAQRQSGVGRQQIYVMNFDGSGQTLLAPNGFASVGAPCFSPGGTQIAFNVHQGSTQSIGLMNADGSQQKILVPNASAPFWSTGSVPAPPSGAAGSKSSSAPSS